ncbi:hypothetical protein MYMAC_001525 [Corallococcus macrosporus DSM 14697]|uniref:Uncharacterized protein n=2 Tax=Corallococcus macrosporus TaxID=35 RepID=A0A250JR21_9BACT|nr:hypothetical protein MYMAC_001525 [Corallococcus macrosporus DSM 14697]
MDSQTALRELEAELDKDVKALPLLKLPFRTVVSALYGVVDNRFHGPRTSPESRENEDVGSAIVNRLSYLLPLLIDCPVEPLGLNLANALSPITPQYLAELGFLLAYAHFSELMPEVHRGYYSVSGDVASGFRLTHASDSFRYYEARDIALTEISMPYYLRPRLKFEAQLVDVVNRFVKQKFSHAGDLVTTVTVIAKQLYEEFRLGIREIPILTDEGCNAAFGVSLEKFNRFRSAWAGISELCLHLADAFAHRARSSSGRRQRELFFESMEWTAPLLRRNFLEGLVLALTGLSGGEIDHLMQFYSFSPAEKRARQVGDGFFPPIAQLADSLHFNPDALRSMLSSRNVLYVLNRAHTQVFDEQVSGHLEPALIEIAKRPLSRLPDVFLAQEIDWGGGDIDLLVYSERENSALHIQAKAAIAPQGARMVAATEGRVKEALRQLSALRKLPPAQIDAIVEKAIGRPVRGVNLVDVVLCRASFGTAKIWERLGSVAVVNPSIVAAVVERLLATSSSNPVTAFAATVQEVADDIQRRAATGWEEATIELGRTTLTMPLLRLDSNVLWVERQKSYERLMGK